MGASNYYSDKHVFRHDVIPESNEQLDIGRDGQRFAVGRFRRVIVDTVEALTLAISSALGITSGGTGATTVAGARTNLGLGTMATKDSPVAIADGGTAATTAATARTSLGLGTIATQDSNNVTISGGAITGITDLAVADGGTGLSAGTSGGVLAFTAAGTLASSAALATNGVVYGGGAGAAPSSTAQGGTNTVLTANAGAPAFSATPTVNTSVQIGVVSTATGALKLAHASSANLTTIQAGNASAAVTYTLPTADGAASTYLQTNGTGTLTWATAGGTAPVFGRAITSSADFTTTSTSFVDLTGATVTFTTGAFPVVCGFAGTSLNSGTNTNYYTVLVDGVDQSAGAGGIMNERADTGSFRHNASFTWQTAALSAASHTIKVQTKTAAGTLTIAGSGGDQYAWWAHEIR